MEHARDAAPDQSEGERNRSITSSIARLLESRSNRSGRLIAATVELRTLDEAEYVASVFALQCPSPLRVCVGLWELFANAIEHGNLEIGYDEKSALLRSNTFEEEIQRRLDLPHFSGRVVRVEFERTSRTIFIRVTDEGNGFDFENLIAPSAEIIRPNGYGILIARQISFDRLTYRGRGNVAEAVIDMATGSSPTPATAPVDRR